MAHRSNIRLATDRDLKKLTELEVAAFQVDRFTEEQIEYLLGRSRATIFVLEKGEELIGAAYMLWRKAHQNARLYNLAVDPAHQGGGYGRKLLRECELESARRDCAEINLEVRQDNEGGIRFYERHGYIVTRSISDYYEDGMAAFKMAKKLRLKVPSQLRIDIPYYAQTLDFTCGSACVMMALKHFKPKQELSRTLEMRIWKEATLVFMMSGLAGTDPFGLSVSCTDRGLGCRVLISLDYTPMLKSVRTPKKQEIMKIVHNDMKRQARKSGVQKVVCEYGIEEIISALYRGQVPIALISTYRLTGDQVPHWVIVTGFDEDNLYIHDPDIASYKKNRSRARHLRVEKSEFLRMSRYGKEGYRCLLLVSMTRRKASSQQPSAPSPAP